jgi:hypothetical protein
MSKEESKFMALVYDDSGEVAVGCIKFDPEINETAKAIKKIKEDEYFHNGDIWQIVQIRSPKMIQTVKSIVQTDLFIKPEKEAEYPEMSE